MPRLPLEYPDLSGFCASPIFMIEAFVHKRFETFPQHQHVHAHNSIGGFFLLVQLVPLPLILVPVLKREVAIKVTLLSGLVPVEGIGLLREIPSFLLCIFFYQICLPMRMSK